MNSTFKVVFNKARGALMVVNEVTSSVQAKGTKTVVATAVAAMIAGVAGTALAEEASESPADTTVVAVKSGETVEDKTGDQGGAYLVYGDQKIVVGDSATFTKNEATVSAGGAVSIVDAAKGSSFGNGVVFSENKSAMQAGALHNQRTASTTLGDNVQFLNNTAVGYGGGAIYQDTDGAASSVTIGSGAQFADNKTETSHGGAVMNFNAGEGAEIEIGDNAVFTRNTATKTGGAVSNWAGDITIGDGVKFESNTAATLGGAIYSDTYGGEAAVTVGNNALFAGNKADQGGAIASNGTIIIGDGATFTKNEATVGGAVSIVDATTKSEFGNGVVFSENKSEMQGGALHNQRTAGTTLGDNVQFVNNTAVGYGGGAIYQDTDGAASSVTIGSGAQFADNKTETSHGGAIMNYNAGEGAVIEIGDNAVFTRNTAEKTGGAISNWAGDISVGDGAKFEANVAEGFGGAIYSDAYSKDASVTINGTASFTGNKAAQGGAIYVKDSELTLNAAEADDMISFKDNVATTEGAGSDLQLAGATVDLIGKGTISFGGSIVGDEDSKITSEVSGVSIADASGFLGDFELAGGKATVTKFFGGDVSVLASAELVTTAEAIDLSKDAEAWVAENLTNTIYVANGGKITLSGLDTEAEYTFDDVTGIKGVILSANSKGSLDLGNVTLNLSDAVEDGKMDVAQAAQLNGIENDAVKQLVVTGVEDELFGSFGAVELAASATDLVVQEGTTLTLNASGAVVTKDGEVAGVAIADGAAFVTAGEGAIVGEVTGEGGTYGVGLGSVEVQGDINVGTLNVDAALTQPGLPADDEAETEAQTFNIAVGQLDIGAEGSVQTAGDVVVTETADVAGTVEAASVEVAGALKVAENGLVKAEEVALAGAEIAGALVAGDLTATQGVTVVKSGVVTADTAVLEAGAKVYGTADIGELTGDVIVGSNDPEDSQSGTLIVGKFNGGVIFADPAFTNGVVTVGDASKVYVEEVGDAGIVHAGQNSIVAIGTQSAETVLSQIAEAGFTQFVEDGDVAAVLYINGSKQVEGSVVADGATVGYSAADNGVYAESNTLTVVDAASFGEDALVRGADVELLGDVYLANAEHGQTLKFVETVEGEGEFHADNVRTAYDRILGVKITNGVNGGIAVAVKEGDELGKLANAVTIGTVQDYFKGNMNGNQFIEGLMSSNNTMNDGEIATALNDVAGIGATAGMASVTMDALSAFNATVAQRTSILAANAEGTTVWADVNGGKYEAKKLMNGAGYTSDIYAGVIGVDTVVSCGAKIGAALTVGTGDTDSKNTTATTTMDSDFFGLSVYTAKQFGDVNVAVGLGYMQGSNDVSVKAYGLNKFSADTDALTIGIRGEVLAKVGSLNLVPHAGLRWTKLSVDSFEAGYKTDIDDLNVFQLPVGVTVSGEFEAAGWNVAPAFDLSVVPAFGDKDADMTLGIAGSKAAATAYGVQVIDSNPVQATLGIDATNGAWAFGLNYKLGVGTDSRMNNSFNANVRYTF